MSDIKEQVRLAIEQFGDKAHERFTYKGMAFYDEPCRSNEFMLDMLSVNNVKLKQLPELIEHDIAYYVDDAHFMWEWDSIEFGWLTFDSNDELLNRHDFIKIRRKTSASLPFDLERAKAGDVVEIRYNNGKIEPVKNSDILNPEKGFTSLLRMKYPKAVKND